MPVYAQDDKIKRGGSNLVFGWTEVPKTVAQVTKDTDNPFLGVTLGLIKGVFNAFSKTVSGAADIVTITRADDEPIIKDTMIDDSAKTK
jgi:putative exosortase-associated protein (TIGR04073 family)